MIKKTLLVLALLVVGLIIFIATRPADFQVSRSITIAAPPSAIFTHLNDFHQWDAWSPWAKLDPAMKKTFDGPPAGVGSIYAWDSASDKVGQGRMTIVESRPSDYLGIKLEFIKPFAATNTADFTLKPQADQTLLTWRMSGHNNFVGKAFSLLMDMDKLVGGDFEKGLAQIKTLAEAEKGK